MAGSSIFVTYGLKSGGGPAFLKRTRTAFGQLQTRTRTGENYSQLQRRKANACNRNFSVPLCSSCWGFPNWSNVSSCSSGGYSFCNNDTFGDPGNWPTRCRTVTLCRFTSFSNFLNTGSCNAVAPTCAPGALNRQCQTVFNFREQDWSVFEEAETCITSSPTASSGAIQVECIAN